MAFSQRRRQTSSRSTPPRRARGQRRAAGRHPRGRSRRLRLEPLEGRKLLSAQPPFLLSASLAAAPAAADDAYIASQHGQLVVDAADGVLQNDTSTAASAGRLLISSFGADNDLVITARSAGAAAGNLRVRFLADRAGNAGAWAEYTPALGDESGRLDVHLQTRAWVPAVYSSTSGALRDPNSLFTVTARGAGSQFNGVRLDIVDNHAGAGNERVEYDHAARTLHLWIDDATTTASSLEAAFRENASVNNAWQFDHYLGSDGSGRLTRDTLVASDGWRQTVQGAAGGQVLSTAADVVTLINATPGLSDAFSAALVSGESGTGLVSPFEEYVHSGQAAAGNMLQFLGSAGAPGIDLIARPGQSLRVDTLTNRASLGYSGAVIHGIRANSTFRIDARVPGPDYDGVEIQFVDNGGLRADSAWYDARTKLLTIDVDVAHGTTADEVIALLAADSYVGQLFTGAHVAGSTGTGTIHADMLAGGHPWAVTSGGVAREGRALIYLGTNSSGQVTTTAAQLASYFNDSTTGAPLAALGLSVSHVAPSSGAGAVAAGALNLQEGGAPLLGATDGADDLAARLVAGPQHGTLELLADGSFTYTPDYGFTGTDQFTYAAESGFYASASATVSIDVDFVDQTGLTAARAGGLYIRSVTPALGTSASTELGFGTSVATHRAVLENLAQPSDWVFAGFVQEGELLQFSVRSEQNGRTGYAFSAADDLLSQVVFSDSNLTLGWDGGIIEQVAVDVWRLHLDPALSYVDGREDLLVEVRIDPTGSTTDLGTIEQTTASDLALAGEHWYALEAAHTGWLTVETSHTGAVVATGLYDARGQLLTAVDPSAGATRLDWEVVEGDRYLIKLASTGATAELDLTNLVGLADGQLTVFGTSGADVLEYDASGVRQLSINGVTYRVSPADVSALEFDGGAGDDQVTLWGTAGDDQATLHVGSATMSGSAFAASVSGVETIVVQGRGGTDTVQLHDSAGDDTLTLAPTLTEIVGTGYHNTAAGFERVTATSSGAGTDTASFDDSTGDDAFVAWPTFATLTGPGFQLRAENFDAVHAYARAGGNDSASLYGSNADDTLVATPEYARFYGAGFSNRVKFFDHVDAYSLQAGNDTAWLWDSAGNDILTATPAAATLAGTGFDNQAIGFRQVVALARAGGVDDASLYDSAGDDTFQGAPEESTLSGAGYSIQAVKFDAVHAYANSGGNDVAELVDSAGNDTFVAAPTLSRLFGADYLLRAKFFEQVHAYARSGGDDTARLTGSASIDTLVFRPDYTRLTGNGYLVREKFFEHVEAYGVGDNDTARLYTGSDDDILAAAASAATLTRPGRDLLVSKFSAVEAYAASTGAHRKDVETDLLDFVLETLGPWIDV